MTELLETPTEHYMKPILKKAREEGYKEGFKEGFKQGREELLNELYQSGMIGEQDYKQMLPEFHKQD